MVSSSLIWIFNVIANFIGVFLTRLFGSFLPKELDSETIDTSKDDEIEITSSSCSQRYDVFPSFSGEDVRKSFLSHFLKELNRRLINTFIDHGIERSRPIGPELLLAIKGSRIAIVVFSKKYASSTWCLNELVEIHKCYKELNQMVIPIFYNVDPSQVRKQTGEFGKVFNTTCKGKPEDQKQSWMQALTDVANLAGEDLHNWRDEAAMIEKIANDVFNKLSKPSDYSGDFVGIEAHLEAIEKILCLESEEVIMVGIVGPSGIGKTTIARALFSQLSRQFHHRSFLTYERTTRDHYHMRLCWEEQFLSEVLGKKDLKICHLGMMEQRLKHKKVLILLDDVDDLELLNTLVGKSRWFGAGSRIIVITQDRRLFKAHEIDLIYEVAFPSEDLALKMFCRSAFGQNSPVDGFMELAVEVTELAGKLPLGLSVLGSSLKGRGKHEWIEMLPRFRNDLDGKIEKVLRVGYERLDRKEQELFLYLAFVTKHFDCTRDLIGDSVDTNTGLKMLAEKSLIRITPPMENVKMHNLLQRLVREIALAESMSIYEPVKYVNCTRDLFGDSVNIGVKILAVKSDKRLRPYETIEMHNLLQRLGREIVCAESIYEPGKRRFLDDVKDILNVLTNKTGTGTLLGIRLKIEDLDQPLNIHKKAFKGMHNLQILIISRNYRGYRGPKNEVRLYLPQDFANLPSNLRLLKWDEYPSKCLPLNFKADFLVELRMENSKLENLWEGTQPLGSLKRMIMSGSRYLKEIPDLSNAINLEDLYLSECESLVTLPSSIQNAIKLSVLQMHNCIKLESLPALLNLESLEMLQLNGCFRLRNFPQVYLDKWSLYWQHENDIEVEEDCSWKKNPHGVDFLDFFRKCVPRQLRTKHIVYLTVRDSMIEKLWEGVQPLGFLVEMDLSECGNLKEFPDLSKATDLERLKLNNCKSLVTIPSTIGNLQKLRRLEMKGCTWLEVLPTNVNLSSLIALDLRGCKRLRSFPQISWSIIHLNLDDTAIEEVPCCIENFSMLEELKMRGCKRLKNISPNIFRLRGLEGADFSECVEVVTALSHASMVETTSEDHSSLSENIFDDHLPNNNICHFWFPYGFKFSNCFNLDGDARELILRSFLRPTFLPGGNVPKYFTHRSSTNSLTVNVPQSSLSQEFLGFKACVVLEPISNPNHYAPCLRIRWHFRGVDGWHCVKLDMIYNKDHLVLVPLKFRTVAPSELDYNNDVEFEFFVVNNKSDDSESSRFQRIKGCGIRVLDASPSPAGSDGSKKPLL